MTQQAPGNGPTIALPPTGDLSQQLVVNLQYIKDLSFENPRAPHSLVQSATPPNVDIRIDVRAQDLGPDTYEVILVVNASAKIEAETLFLLELVYGSVVTVRNVPQELMAAVLMVETPRLMFPFARAIVADATREGGFPALMINPIDFADLLRRNAADQQQQPPAGPASA